MFTRHLMLLLFVIVTNVKRSVNNESSSRTRRRAFGQLLRSRTAAVSALFVMGGGLVAAPVVTTSKPRQAKVERSYPTAVDTPSALPRTTTLQASSEFKMRSSVEGVVLISLSAGDLAAAHSDDIMIKIVGDATSGTASVQAISNPACNGRDSECNRGADLESRLSVVEEDGRLVIRVSNSGKLGSLQGTLTLVPTTNRTFAVDGLYNFSVVEVHHAIGGRIHELARQLGRVGSNIEVQPVSYDSSSFMNQQEAKWCAYPSHWKLCKSAYNDLALNFAMPNAKHCDVLICENGDEANAFQHCLWASALYVEHGPKTAEGFLSRHEWHQTGPDHERDLINNGWGRDVANEVNATAAQNPGLDKRNDLFVRCYELARDNRLTFVPSGQA